MRSLLIKDWIVFRKFLGTQILFLVIISIVIRNPTASSTMIAVWIVTIFFHMIQTDSRSEVLVNSLPVSRGAVVTARYCEMVCVGPALFFFVELASAAVRSLNLFEFPAMGWTHLGGILTLSALWPALVLPLYYRLGPVAVRYTGVVIFVISAGIGVVVGMMYSLVKHGSPDWIMAIWAWIQNLAAGDIVSWMWLLLGTALIYAASLLLSVQLYQRREF